MRTRTLLCQCAAALSTTTITTTHAAPAAVAIDLDAVIEQVPQPAHDSIPRATLQRAHRISETSDDTEPVDLWVDDFGNIEAIPPAAQDHAQAPLNEAAASDETTAPRQPAPAHGPEVPTFTRPSVSDFLTEHYRVGIPSEELVSHFFSGNLGTLIYLALGGILLLFLLVAFRKSMPRPYRMRTHHRRGHSRFSQ